MPRTTQQKHKAKDRENKKRSARRAEKKAALAEVEKKPDFEQKAREFLRTMPIWGSGGTISGPAYKEGIVPDLAEAFEKLWEAGYWTAFNEFG